MRMTQLLAAALALGAATWLAPMAGVAQSPGPATQAAPGIKRTILQKMDVPGSNYETIIAVVEVQPNFKAGRHTHPGNVTGIVSEGEFYLTVDGQAEKMFKAGDNVLVPDGTVHDEGTKDKPAKLIAVYVVEKGKPLAAPAAPK
jgi:quercetin dioxygenase-like cupin family protein